MKREALLEECRQELERGAPRRAGLHLVCDLVLKKSPAWDWIGFFLAEVHDRMLVLGPFAGRPSRTVRIPWGEGAAGEAAERGATVVRDDAYASTPIGPWVQSECAVPVVGERDPVPVAVLVVGARLPAAFSTDDQWFLEKLAKWAEPSVPPIPRP